MPETTKPINIYGINSHLAKRSNGSGVLEIHGGNAYLPPDPAIINPKIISEFAQQNPKGSIHLIFRNQNSTMSTVKIPAKEAQGFITWLTNDIFGPSKRLQFETGQISAKNFHESYLTSNSNSTAEIATLSARDLPAAARLSPAKPATNQPFSTLLNEAGYVPPAQSSVEPNLCSSLDDITYFTGNKTSPEPFRPLLNDSRYTEPPLNAANNKTPANKPVPLEITPVDNPKRAGLPVAARVSPPFSEEALASFNSSHGQFRSFFEEAGLAAPTTPRQSQQPGEVTAGARPRNLVSAGTSSAVNTPEPFELGTLSPTEQKALQAAYDDMAGVPEPQETVKPNAAKLTFGKATAGGAVLGSVISAGTSIYNNRSNLSDPQVQKQVAQDTALGTVAGGVGGAILAIAPNIKGAGVAGLVVGAGVSLYQNSESGFRTSSVVSDSVKGIVSGLAGFAVGAPASAVLTPVGGIAAGTVVSIATTKALDYTGELIGNGLGEYLYGQLEPDTVKAEE